MNKIKHIVIYSHGFGVRKDDRGLLTDIAKSLPEVESILFDYNEVDEENHILKIPPLSVQAEMLNRVIRTARETNPGVVLDLVCHSQGTIIAALAKPEGIRKTLFLAPSFDMNIERTLKRYASRPGADINLDGVSTLPSLDGFIRIIPSQYWNERKNLRPFDICNAFAEQTELIVIEANQDELLEKVDSRELSQKIKLTSVDGNHGFSGDARKHLLEVVRLYLG